MDTTLMTFHLQTSAYAQSVRLVGSWDNFTKRYLMERDDRRSRSQWRGCYRFEDIICDGDGGSSPKRTGGLKMGSTYYYYYELDDGTETYDVSLPSTTSCPYLPGQPVNLLSVPVDVQPRRVRSASTSSVASENIKTMNPADKFVTLRPLPPAPFLVRLRTSSASLLRKRTARSVSPNQKPSWTPTNFWGLRNFPAPYCQDGDDRGRSASATSLSQARNVTGPSISAPSLSEKNVRSVPQSREVSPESFQRSRSRSRDPSPLRQFVTQQTSTFNAMALEIPDEIQEEAEDDDNFASVQPRLSMSERGLTTPLAPPPSHRSHTPRSGTPKDTSKPLPQVPGKLTMPLVPQPLRIREPLSIPEAEIPRSHFSVSTTNTTIASPSSSQYAFSSPPSITGSIDDEDFSAESDVSTYSPIDRSSGGFRYGLPENEYTSAATIGRKVDREICDAPGARDRGIRTLSALEELLAEMGYLGDAIVGK